MWPAKKKKLKNINVLFAIFDLKSLNKEQLLESLVKMVTNKLIATYDSFGLLLANTSKTKNTQRIAHFLKTDIRELDPQKIVECINTTEVSSGPPVSLLDALLLGICYISRGKVLQTTTLQLVYLTDLENVSGEYNNFKFNKVNKGLDENLVYLYIVGPSVKLPYIISKYEDVKENMKKVMVDESNPAHVLAKKIVQESEGRILCDVRTGTSIVHFFKHFRSRAASLVPISIGTKLNIPTKTTKIKHFNVDLFVANKPYTTNTYIREDDASIEIPSSALINGVICHGKCVKIEDEDMFKFETERSFDLVGFTSSRNLPEAYFEGNWIYLVEPRDEFDQNNCKLFQTLVKVLAEGDEYAIMQRIYYKNNFPRYFVLKPECGAQSMRFVMTSLPYADEVVGKFMYQSKPKKSEVKVEDDFTNFCESIDVCSDKCTLEIPLAPCMIMESLTDNIAKEVAKKRCSKNFKFKETEPFDLGSFVTNQYWETLKNNWPEVEEATNT